VIARIRSGGQTGADVAALRAAKARGVPTGGVMPRGFRTLTGPRPEYAALYGVTEHASPAYPPRTFENVRDSDVTVRIAVDFNDPGEAMTLKAIERYGRPHADIGVRRGGGPGLVVDDADIFAAVEVIEATARKLGREVVVNIAGNSEHTAPGIERMAEAIVAILIDAATGIEVTAPPAGGA
jgi:hypothetical protein